VLVYLEMNKFDGQSSYELQLFLQVERHDSRCQRLKRMLVQEWYKAVSEEERY
jgi:hypothetical protein